MTMFKWSRTAASNSIADSTINWQEGMAPSAVNDSARAEMAAVAKYRDDIAGAITTGGTSTAYTVTSYQGFDTLANMDGKVIAFTPHASNAGASTLNVDGLGAKPLRSSPSVELPAGTLILGTPYVATYNNTAGVWYLQGFFGNPYNLPIGGILPFAGSTAPNSSFVLPYGQAVSRTTYASLFSIISTTYGVGDGTTTFNLPKLNGRVMAFLDNMGGSAAGVLTTIGSGTTLGATGGAETHTLQTTEIPAHTHVNTLTDPGHSHNLAGNVAASGAATNATGVSGSTGTQINATQSATTGITITNASAGGGDAHNNLQPTILVNCIMRII